LTRGLGTVPTGTRLTLSERAHAEVVERGPHGSCVVHFSNIGSAGVLGLAERLGEIPLPPYIEKARKRDGEAVIHPEDRERYQTVYAQTPGAVAAPTAGLHFTPELLSTLEAQGHEIARVTLHVGPGTFRPVEVADPSRHPLDAERFVVGQDAARAIEKARQDRRPIVAVGTTVVRTLETLGRKGAIAAAAGNTDLLILPGERFAVVTDLVTNFHLPRSSLLMLVSAFAGREPVLAAYQEAVERGYRFYSYGDAMFIRPGEVA
jgi:S-adenosylmethionine:tRNA ribosyltransferase-isomerase